MRARNLKPGFFKNEFLPDIEGPWGRILFSGLWCLADREGRLEDRPRRIKAEIFPYDEKVPSIDKMLNLLQEKGFILRYGVDGNKLIQISKFHEHQKPHNTERQSTLPPAPKVQEPLTLDSPLNNGESAVRERPESLFTDSLNPETKDMVASPPPDGGNGDARVRSSSADFDEFYKSYPRKQARNKALEAWKNQAQKGRLPPIETLLAAVEAQKQWRQWREGVIPHPATWLNQERWNDQAPESQEAQPEWMNKPLSSFLPTT